MTLNINDEQGIEILHFIFERELKPPFRKGYKDKRNRDPYFNRDNKCIGRLYYGGIFYIGYIERNNLEFKICSVFGYSLDTLEWWYPIKPHLKSWMETQLNIKLNDIYQ